jgi:hypothetical protein
MNKALHAARLEAERQFIHFDGVVGIAPGPKLRRGRMVDPEAIVVLVDRKLPRTRVRAGQLIPAEFAGFPTDVREPVLSSSLPGNVECAGDENWLDWQKIHEINQRQQEPPPAEPGDDPPADVPTTEIQGDLFLIKDPSKTLVTTVAGGSVIDVIGAWNLFRASFGDDYDFAMFFIDTSASSGLPGDGNYSTDIFRSETGLGAAMANSRASWGSTRLLRRCNHVWFTLRTLLHEPGHQWLAYVDYRDTAAGSKQTLMHQDWVWGASQAGFHWGRWLSDVKSCMDYDRHEWVSAGAGTYNWVDHNPDESSATNATWFEYWDMDQYLMGLIPASQVGAATILNSPSPTVSDSNSGPYTPASVVSVTVAKVQFEEGARSPDYLNTQRVFHQAHIAITADAAATPAFVAPSQTWITQSTPNFRRATAGRAMIDSSLLRTNHASVYLRDNAADTGTAASTGTFWLSPDVWVRNADDNGTDNQCPVRGQDNWIYVRIHNRSAQSYANVTASVYLGNFFSLAPGTEFVYPVDWAPSARIGSATVAAVPAASGGSDGTTIAKIVWPAAKLPPAAGWHPCLLAEVIPMALTPAGLHHVWENPKLAQRNLTIIDPAQGCPPMSDERAGDTQAIMFTSKVQIGHALRVSEFTEVHIDATKAAQSVHLFLDPGSLIDLSGEDPARFLTINIPLSASKWPAGQSSVQPLPAITIDQMTGSPAVGGPLDGLTVLIPEDTELGILNERTSEPLRLRFENDAYIRVGYRSRSRLAERYALIGCELVVVNGRPLLSLATDRAVSMRLRLKPGEQRILNLLGIVTAYRGSGERVRYDVTEMQDGRTIGGVSVEVGL